MVHYKRPKKNFHWMVVSRFFNTSISWVDYSDIYGDAKKRSVRFKLYSSYNNLVLEKNLIKDELPADQQIH